MTRFGWVLCLVVLGAVAGGAAAGSVAAVTDDGAASTAAASEQTTNVSISTLTGPQRLFVAAREAETADEIQNVSTTESEVVYPRATLVVLLSAPDLQTAVSRQSGDDTSERLRSLLASDRAVLRSSQSGVVDTPKTLALTDSAATTAVRVNADIVALAVNVSRLSAMHDRNGNGLADDGGTASVQPPESYRLRFTYEGTTARTDIRFENPSATLAPTTEGPLSFLAGAGQSVSGTTTLPAGTNLSVVFTTTGDPSFVQTRRATVDDDSTFTATFDLSDAPAGTNVTVVVRRGDRTLGGRTGRIETPSATARVPSRVSPGDILRIRSPTSSHPGFLVVRRNTTDGEILAARSFGAGESETRLIPVDRSADRLVVQAYLDIDGNGRLDADGPDRLFDPTGPPLATVDVGPPPPDTTTRTRTATPMPETETTTDTATAATDTATPTRPDRGQTTVVVTPTSGPGFGVGTALAALVLFLLGRR
ncbi:BGTF surface domain-containing protein [Halorientalis litorea]|uniref:BGTF surface domain-containing protein n=1 Tax=Halorientalis litorea TaxID=2931977 RepID=UPI001FF531D3|nr:BGTF surface domain-containing protein [Halorientalis litorea]